MVTQAKRTPWSTQPISSALFPVRSLFWPNWPHLRSRQAPSQLKSWLILFQPATFSCPFSTWLAPLWSQLKCPFLMRAAALWICLLCAFHKALSFFVHLLFISMTRIKSLQDRDQPLLFPCCNTRGSEHRAWHRMGVQYLLKGLANHWLASWVNGWIYHPEPRKVHRITGSTRTWDLGRDFEGMKRRND